MKKQQAQDLLDDGTAQNNLAQAVGQDRLIDYLIVLGRFEAAGEIKGDDDEGWTPLAIHRTAGLEMQHDQTLASQGGARVVSKHRAGDAGYAFQGKRADTAGIWLWGSD